jgi:hypothetical protein
MFALHLTDYSIMLNRSAFLWGSTVAMLSITAFTSFFETVVNSEIASINSDLVIFFCHRSSSIKVDRP